MQSTKYLDCVRQARAAHALSVEKNIFFTPINHFPEVEKLPLALKILLENVVRRAETDEEAALFAERIFASALEGAPSEEIAYMPSRVLFQDFTGVPVFVDFAAMRDATLARGGDPSTVNPQIPCTLIVDHSVIADKAGDSSARSENEALEARRNNERFAFLKWAANSFDKVKIVPPGVGICHQLNMERFSEVVSFDALYQGEGSMACFDTLVGTDSHTTTANGLGVLAWGVGGIEAEAAALGQSISMLVPPVIGLKLTGNLPDQVSGMDVALRVAELLRAENVVGSLVEVFGEGLSSLSATQRACISNMTPEYGCTTTLFPVDERALDYLRLTGRSAEQIELIESFLAAQGINSNAEASYAKVLELDLSSLTNSVAGPSRPHDRNSLNSVKTKVEATLRAHQKDDSEIFEIQLGSNSYQLKHGSIAIAAITSCTTATDPAMMVAAGLLARKACEKGLTTQPWVKKIFAPGSQATTLLLDKAGLSHYLDELGFYVCGYGCMSCIGNSGEIYPALKELSEKFELTSVLSGNRNFEGRISPDVSQNYLCQPALVVAYALVGNMDIDLSSEPLGFDAQGEPVYLKDIMPSNAEIDEVLAEVLKQDLFDEGKDSLFAGSAAWQAIEASKSAVFSWDDDSTYVRRAPYFELAQKRDALTIEDARVLAYLGDFVTTDHISPAGSISYTSPAAKYLTEHQVEPAFFNSYGARRGNHEVMMRGTFANVKLENKLADGKRGSWTYDFVAEDFASIYDVAMHYQAVSQDSIILAGKMYGSGSSRDWAGKGPALLGVKVVIAESFERIHRSNLVQMGVVPLQFMEGDSAESLGLTGRERFSIKGLDFAGQSKVALVRAVGDEGQLVEFEAKVRIDTAKEFEFVSAGGILPYVLEHLS